MEKLVTKDNAYYKIVWSPFGKYDRHLLSRLMPVTPGIVGLFYQSSNRYTPVLFIECWRDGLRDGIKNFMDPVFLKFKELRKQVDLEQVHISYTVIESSPKDMADILYFLIKSYKPKLNSQEFKHSGRYKNVYVSETQSKDFSFIKK